MGKESFNWENSQEHCILISEIDLIQDILCGPENIQGHLETLANVPMYEKNNVKTSNLPSTNSSFFLDFWYRKGKQAYWGQSRRGLDLGDPKNASYCSHIEMVGRLLVWSDCLYTRDDILLPSIVLPCRWPNFPKPGNVLTKSGADDELNWWGDCLLPSCGRLWFTLDWSGLAWIDLMGWWEGEQLTCLPISYTVPHPSNDSHFIFVNFLSTSQILSFRCPKNLKT